MQGKLTYWHDCIGGANLVAFRDLLIAHPLPVFEAFTNEFADETPERAYQYFVNKRATLLKFIEDAIAQEVEISTSL